MCNDVLSGEIDAERFITTSISRLRAHYAPDLFKFGIMRTPESISAISDGQARVSRSRVGTTEAYACWQTFETGKLKVRVD